MKRKDLWRPLVVALLALPMAACDKALGFETQEPSSPAVATETYQRPLPTLQSTPLIELTPPNEAVQEVEQALTDWLNGKTKIAPEQLMLITQSGERLPLGTLRESDPSTEEIALYQGVLLGTKTVDGQLILIIGFETKDGTRYTLPFNAGPFENGLLVEVVPRQRFTAGWDSDTVSQRISVPELAQRLPRIFGKPICFFSVFSLAGFPEDQVIEPVRKQILPTIPIAQDVYHFVLQGTRDGLPTPSETIKPLLNRIPTTVPIDSLPSVDYIEAAGDWVTTP